MGLALDEIAIFVEVVERGSLGAAAKALGLAPSVVTKRIQALESRLEVQLLVRTTRKVTVTDAGRLLFDQVSAVPRMVAEAEERVREATTHSKGRLRVIMPSYFASSGFHHEVIPRYLAAHPEVDLSLTIVGEPRDHLRDDFDLLVAGKRPDEQFPDTSFVCRRLMKFRLTLLASPAYLAAHGTPRHPRELLSHNCLSYPSRDWHFVDPHDGSPLVVRVSGTLTTNSNAVLYAATMNGIGIARSFTYFFDKELEDGRVVSVLDEHTRGSYVDIHLFYPAAKFLPARTRAFIDALAAHFEAQE